jgi:putative ABC transport system permease protein
VNPGFNPQDAVVAGVFRPRPAYGSPGASASYVDFARRVVDEIAVLPGVQAVAATTGTPLSNVAQSQAFAIAGRPWESGAEMPVASFYNVGPDYFRAMGIPLLRGRQFQTQDTADSPPVVIVNEFIARSFFSGTGPIGQRISIGGSRRLSEIVGIAGDVKGRTLDGDLGPQVYLPFAQGATRTMAFVVRGATSSAAFPGALRAALSRVDPDQPITNIRPLTTLVDESLARERFAMTLFTVFSVVALLLAALGIYGVMAYAVGQRTGEFGLRMALGAQSGDVLRLVLVQGGRLVALGVLAGLGGALLLTQLLEKLLFNVKSYDPLTFAGIVGLLALVAGAACLLPARRASRVNPMTALRTD